MVRVLETMSDWLSVGTDIKIDELRNYLNTLKNQLENMVDDYEKRIKAEAKTIQDEQTRQDFYEWSGEEYWLYKETFPRILLNSFYVTAYTLLESEIYSVARRVGKKQTQVFDVSEIRGKDYLQSACYYIEKLTAVDAKTFSSWSELTEGRRLRNIIIHSNGKLIENKDIELAEKHKVCSESSIELPSGRSIKELSITYDYCKDFLDTLRAFFAELYKRMKAGSFL